MERTIQESAKKTLPKSLINIPTRHQTWTVYGGRTWRSTEKIKSRKTAGLDEITRKVRKTGKFDDILLGYCNAVYKQNTTEKGDLRITKNYRGITLTAISAKIYNVLLLNGIRPEIEKILRKNQNSFRRNRSATSLSMCSMYQEFRGNTIIRRFLQGI